VLLFTISAGRIIKGQRFVWVDWYLHVLDSPQTLTLCSIKIPVEHTQ